MKLLTLFNHTGSRESFKRGFDSWRAARYFDCEVRIIEDGESDRAVEGVEYVRVNAGSSGHARWSALKYFMSTDFTHLMVLDNDLLFARDFDLVSVMLWRLYRKHYFMALVSPLRSWMPGHVKHEQRMDGYVWKHVTSDQALFMDRESCQFCLDAIDWSKYPQGWGWALSEKLSGCIVPYCSMVKHVGTFDGQNTFHIDDGYKFPGENWTAI